MLIKAWKSSDYCGSEGHTLMHMWCISTKNLAVWNNLRNASVKERIVSEKTQHFHSQLSIKLQLYQLSNGLPGNIQINYLCGNRENRYFSLNCFTLYDESYIALYDSFMSMRCSLLDCSSLSCWSNRQTALQKKTWSSLWQKRWSTPSLHSFGVD